MRQSRVAVFLDRDGVLNEVVERDGQPASPRSLEQFVPSPDLDAVSRLSVAGLLVFIITNQPDIARGHTAQPTLAAMMDALRARVHIDDVRICTHDDHDGCACRKPKPGMILDLARHWHVDRARSWVIGDMWRDVGAARAAGCRSVLLRRAYNRDVAPDLTADTLAEAVDIILAHTGDSE